MRPTRALALGVFAATLAGGADWPQWRGPTLNGVAPDSAGLPTSWSVDQNVVWRAKLPSWSAATPIISGDTVFVASAEEGFSDTGSGSLARHAVRGLMSYLNWKDDLLLIALDAGTGKERWRRVLGEGNRIRLKHNEVSPSPVADGKRVWVMTGTGVLSCFDFEGRPLWKRDIQDEYGEFGLNWGYASSPLLHDGALYAQVLHGYSTDDPSYVLAVDAVSGKTVWKVDRPTDVESESLDAYATPTIVTLGERSWLAVSGAGYVTLHDLADGREAARAGGLTPTGERGYRIVASPLAAGEILIAPSRRKPLTAFRVGPGPTLEKAWSVDAGPDVPTPVSDGERLWIIDDRGVAQCLRVADGSVVWPRKRVEPGTYSASPLLADGKIFALSEEGTTTVLAAEDEFEILATNKLDDYALASPAAAADRLYIRTANYLYCLGLDAAAAD